MKINSSTNVQDLGSSPNIANAMLWAVRLLTRDFKNGIKQNT